MRKNNRALKTVQKFFPKVKYVVDANKEVMVEITKADNDHALVQDHVTCALAVACKRTTHADGVLIGTTKAYVIHGNKAVRYALGQSVSREIVSFDRNAGFDTGWYKMVPCCETQRLDYDRAGKEDHGATSRKAKPFKHYTRGVRTSLQKL